MTHLPYTFIIKISATSKVNTICNGGQLLVSGSQAVISKVPGVKVPCPRVASHKPQGPKTQGPRAPDPRSRVPKSGVPGPGPQSPGSQVQILACAVLVTLKSGLIRKMRLISKFMVKKTIAIHKLTIVAFFLKNDTQTVLMKLFPDPNL